MSLEISQERDRQVHTFARHRSIFMLATMIALLLAPSTYAFIPIGGYDSFGVLHYQTWRFGAFDTNNDGNITTGEGLPIIVEGGKSGFLPDEIDQVRASFDVWEDVPTSYVSFKFDGVVTDPILTGLEPPDFLTTVAFQVTEGNGTTTEADRPDVLVPGVAFPVLGVTITLFSVEEQTLTVGGTSVVISAGTIIDSDIVIDATSHRPALDGTPALVEIEGTLVHEIGHLVGLGHPALNNLEAQLSDPTDETSIIGLKEREVFWHTAPDGIAGFIGVTPTMFPIAFTVEDAIGEETDGGTDLAPDDISAISWLYPRGSQVNFFNVANEARTNTRGEAGIPSVPIIGGHVVAWADLDNNPSTERVPLFSTMTGLYVNVENDLLEGQFDLLGMWKQFEVPRGTGGVLFNPTYTLTLSPLNESGLDTQAPPGSTPDSVDGLQGSNSSSSATRSDYNNAFPSEVFREGGNVFGVLNHDAGTPMVWDFTSNSLVSADSGKSLNLIVRGRPMFGDRNDVCPLNIIFDSTDPGGGGTEGEGEGEVPGGEGEGEDPGGEGEGEKAELLGLIDSGGGGNGPTLLREFRDNYLLDTAVGMAVVDLYYSVSPFVARYLINHDLVLGLFKRGVHAMYWVLENRQVLALGLLPVVFISVWLLRRRNKGAVAAALALFCLGALPADARIAFVTTPQMTEGASAVVTGTVQSVSSRYLSDQLIVTDTVLEVEDTVKGNINKQATITITVLGGRVGATVLNVTEMPRFEAGEEVLLYLTEDDTLGYTTYGGVRGTFDITTDLKTGEKTLHATDASGELALKNDAKSLPSETLGDGGTPSVAPESAKQGNTVELSAYLQYLRGLVASQQAEKK